MNKTTTHFISGVFSTEGVITAVHLHKTTDGGATFDKGVKTKVTEVISLIEAGYIVHTVLWNYATASWRRGAKVHVVNEQGQTFLRTNGDAVVNDNLDNLLDMYAFFN